MPLHSLLNNVLNLYLMKKALFFAAFLLPLHLISQTVNESFDNYSNEGPPFSPPWYGHIDSVKVITSTSSTTFPKQLLPSLRVFCMGNVNSIYISTPNNRSLSDSTEWGFWARVPNSTPDNNAKIYLVSDRQDLLDPALSGYYVSLGLSGKKLTLYKQSGGVSTPVINGSGINISASQNHFRVKVKRDIAGNWKMYSDTSAKGAGAYFQYQLEGIGFSDDIDTTSWFGMVTKYSTSSTSQTFYFDDFYSGPVVIDTILPTAAISTLKPDVFVKFSEPVNLVSAMEPLNYCILELPSQSSVPCNPDAVMPVAGKPFEYKLVYNGSPLLEDVLYRLVVKNVQDLSGNVMLADTFTFAFYEPKSFDVVINEIMADPDPIVNLPAAEYVELYNRTDFPLNLEGWKFAYGSGPTVKVLPSVIIQPKGFVIISCANAMEAYGITIPVFTNCTSSLTNSGTVLILANSSGKMIHTVTYSDLWYKSSIKKAGGWSLEMIDPNNPCGGQENWRDSEDANGGTPGKKNKVTELYAPQPDNIVPQIEHIGVNGFTPDRFTVYFSEQLDSLSFANPMKFSVLLNGVSLGNPASIKPAYPSYHYALFKMPAGHPVMLHGNIYTLLIADSVRDCVGNMLALNSSGKFALPEVAEPNDIIINELLSNPPDGGKDYVEIYNLSDKVINLGTLVVATWDSISIPPKIDNPKEISLENRLIFPGEYYCLTTDPAAIRKLYETTNPKGFVKMESMPSYNNDNGIVVIGNKSLQVIDKFTYRPGMHFPLIKSTKGVSLERISFRRPTEDPSNWHSASSSVGYGTPAYKNSQYAEFAQSENPFTITPEIFSPDNDGTNDVLGIAYKFDNPGYVANIVIYDSKGRLVRNIAKNALLGTEGVFTWDGVNLNNEKSAIGIYIIFSEVFDLQGNATQYKNTAVLGGKIR